MQSRTALRMPGGACAGGGGAGGATPAPEPGCAAAVLMDCAAAEPASAVQRLKPIRMSRIMFSVAGSPAGRSSAELGCQPAQLRLVHSVEQRLDGQIIARLIGQLGRR